MRFSGRALSRFGAVTIALACSASVGDAAPLGFPVPTRVEPADILATSTESGDVHALLPGAGTCSSAPHREILLPADDAPHDEAWIEWWWWFGQLTASDGRRFGFMLLAASKPTAHYHAVDYAITDLSTGTFHHGRQPLILGRPQQTRDGFDIRDDHARATGGDGHDQIHIDVDGYELDISLEATRPPVPAWEDGYVQAYCQAAYMFSRTRMSVTGTLAHAGDSIPVEGTATYNRQWGFNVAMEVLGWEFMSFELDDGRDVLFFVASLRKNGDEFGAKFGSISDADGNVTALHPEDFTLTPVRSWQRDATCAYPVDWQIEIPGLRFLASAKLDSTEVRATRTPLAYLLWPMWPLYWDGPANVSGDATGRGWFDLGHYCEF